MAVVCYNSPPAELENLVSSLLVSIEQLKQRINVAAIPVYLIDNSDSDQLDLDLLDTDKQLMLALGVELRLLHGHGNIGYGSAHNLILNKLKNEFHLILNPDVVTQPDTLSTGIEFLQNNPEVVLVSPHAIDEAGNKQFLCKRVPSLFTFLVRGFFPASIKKPFQARLARFEMHDLPEDEASTDIPIVSGCFMLSRTDTLKEINGFDERYFLYFEDFDLSLRMGKLGKLAYLPTMKIIHAGGHAARKGFAHLGMFARSGIRFFNSHGWRFIRQ
jgi:hypothetical protein